MLTTSETPLRTAGRLRSFFRGPQTTPETDHLNLRAWFLGYLFWMALLTLSAVLAFRRYEAGESAVQGVWLVSIALFYLSLCCLFFPAPTAWVVMLLASNQVALLDSIALRVLVVACACGLATAVANLNEYHIITFILRYGRVAQLRNTRVYQAAARWFETAPFMVILVMGFLPIPVDVVRWLAIADRYPRWRFFIAYFIGRSSRYAVLAASVVRFNLDWWDILIFQAALLLLAAAKVVHSWLKKRDSASVRVAFPASS